MVAAIVFTGIVDLVILTKYGAEIELEFDYLTPSFIIFLTTWTTNWVVEIAIIYYVITNDMDMSKSDEFITSNQDIDSIVGTTSNTLGGGDDGTITNL